MLIHIFVDSVVFSTVPKKTVSIVLNIDVESKNFELSAPLCDDVAANFCKTIHVPVPENQAHTSDCTVIASAFTVEGISFPLGECKYTFTSIEHGIPKKLNFKSKKHPEVGNISITVFYYRFPMDIADFSLKDQSAASRQQKYIREYTFLRLRRENWGGHRTTTFDHNTQRLLDNDASILSSDQRRARSKAAAPASRPAPASRSAPKLRKTMMSVGYVGIHWPETGDGDKEEKLMQKLHIAEEKRLHLLKEAADRARRRNIVTERKAQAIKAHKKLAGRDEGRLRDILRKKEKALKKLEIELQESERNAAAAAAARRRTVIAESKARRGKSVVRKKKALSFGPRAKSLSATNKRELASNSSHVETQRRRARSLDGIRSSRASTSSSARYPRRSSSADDGASKRFKHATRVSQSRNKDSKSKAKNRKQKRFPSRPNFDDDALDLIVGRSSRLCSGDDSDSLSILIDIPGQDKAQKENARRGSFLDKIKEFQKEQQEIEDKGLLNELTISDHVDVSRDQMDEQKRYRLCTIVFLRPKSHLCI